MVSADTSNEKVLADICERLSQLGGGALALPSSCYKETGAPSVGEVKDYLLHLVSDHPGSFLQRYGRQLQARELSALTPVCGGDFEADHWLRTCTLALQQAAEAAAHPQRLPAAVKNRRLAALERLDRGGDFFSDDAMRRRAPLLHWQIVGQYLSQAERDAMGLQEPGGVPSNIGAGGGGQQLYYALTRQQDEQDVRQQLQEEQEQEAAQEEEEEEEEEEEVEDAAGTPSDERGRRDVSGVPLSASGDAASSPATAAAAAAAAAGARHGGGTASLSGSLPVHPSGSGSSAGAAAGVRGVRLPVVLEGAALQRQRDELRREMEGRFLTGAEHRHVDYASIDTDSELDGHWVVQQARDAEEAYFDAD